MDKTDKNGTMVTDVEMQQPLRQIQTHDIMELEWSMMMEVLQLDNDTGLQKIIQDHGAKAAMFISGGTKQETSLFRAAKVSSLKCLQLLLTVRSSPEIINQPDCDGLSPFLVATMNTQPQVMEMLIENGCDVNFRNDNGFHALHILSNALIIGKSQSLVFDSLDALMKTNGIDLDPKSKKGLTPLRIIADAINQSSEDSHTNSNFITFSRRLYEKGASLLVSDSSGRTTKDILQEKGVLTAIQIAGTPKKIIRPWVSQFYDCLLLDQGVHRFKEIVVGQSETALRNTINSWIGSKTILFYVVDKMDTVFMTNLLDAGADSWRTNGSGELPIHGALARGHNEILDILIDHMKQSGNLDLRSRSFELFHELLANTSQCNSSIEGVDRSKCLHRLFKNDLEIDVNKQRDSKNIKEGILHVAASLNNQEALELLIEHGSFIGAHQITYNKDHGTVIDAINVQTLESAMDSSITSLRSSGQSSKELNENVLHPDYTLNLDYRFLVPPNPENKENKDSINEVATLMDLKESNSHLKSIKHPLVQVFLYVKWRKVLPLYLINLLLYLGFVTLLTYFMYSLTDLRVIESLPIPNNQTNEAAIELSNIISDLSQRVLIITFFILPPFCYMILREIFQMIFTKRSYFTNLENYLEWFLLIVVAILTTVSLGPDVTRHLCAWAMIVAWYEFVLILGRAPPLAIYVTMLRHVSWNFVKLIFLYGSLILAFAISFSIILKPAIPVKDGSGNSFVNFWSTLPRAIVMATGEFEYSDLSGEFPQEVIFTVSTVLIFMAFLFLIFLVLMNVMNGMAVSDTSQVIEDATLYSLTSRLELIYLIEEFLLKLPFLKKYLDQIHVLTNSTNLPRLLVKLNDENKNNRILYGKKHIQQISNQQEVEDPKYCKLDNRTTIILKQFHRKTLEKQEQKRRGDPLQECLNLLKDLKNRQSGASTPTI